MEIQSGIDLTGKVAVVTGAGRGIGAAIAGAFAKAGADIVVADLNYASAQQTADRLTGLGRRALAVTADVGVPAQVSRLFDIVRAEFGRLDILVNNAGVWFRKPFLEISDSEWDLVLTTNLKGNLSVHSRSGPHHDASEAWLHHQHRFTRRPLLQPRPGRSLRRL